MTTDNGTKLLINSVLILFAFLLFSMFNLKAQSKKTISSEEMWNITRVGAAVVSPDNTIIAFTVTKYDIEKNTSETNIYIQNMNSKEVRQMTTGGKDNSPVFSPDGSQLAFISRRGEDAFAQLYLIAVNGGEAKRITKLPVSVSSPKWFPDGKKLAFVANVLPDYDGDFDKLEKMIKEKKDSKVTAKVTENRIYRYWDSWLTDGYYPRIFSIDIESKTVVDLLPNTSIFFALSGGADYDIAPDGRKIAFSANSIEPPYDNLNYDIFILEADGSGKFTNYTQSNPAGDFGPKFSKDGSKILYGFQKRSDFYADKVTMAILNLPTNTRTIVSENIDLSADNWLWSEKEDKIYFLAEDRAMQSIFEISPDGKNFKQILHKATNSGLSLAPDDRLIFTHQTLNAPSEIYSVKRNGSNLTQLTDFNGARLKNIDFGKTEDVTYKGADGKDVQMFIVYPPNFDPNKKWPLVIMIHGGPHGTFGDQFHYRWNAHLFASPGYVVIMPNFHGSTSFGQDFAISIHGQHPVKPYQDIMKATDYMIERGFIDSNRMAATGGSYGGYLVSWIAGHTDRYACLVNHAGVYDLMLQFGSDITTNRDKAYGGTPWQNFDIMQSHNPAMHAANFKTPMLIIHGEKDYRVPVAQAFVVYGIYKSMGLDSRLVYYPDENHWILSAQNSIKWYEELHNWLEKYLKN